MKVRLSQILILLAALGPGLFAADPAPQVLIREVATHARLRSDLEDLCDGIGPRLAGSPAMRRARAWALARLRAYGAVNVHEEAFDLGRPWRRGEARARLLNANGQALHLAQMAWTPGTRGAVKGEVVLLDAPSLADLEAASPGLRGKVVLLRVHPRATREERRHLEAFRARLRDAWRQAGPGLVLLPSDKNDGLMEMGGGPGDAYPVPTAFLAREDARLLQRLLARGIRPRVEASLGGRFGSRPVRSANVVGEVPGTDLKDEVVIVAAHLDSWDLATGATDDGTGVVVALETLRALVAAGLRSRRTLRIVLFSGEEEGLLGSRAYVDAHAAVLPKLQAVLVDDGGAGRMTGFADMEVDAWDGALEAALAPAKVLGAGDVPYLRLGGSDQDTFLDRGVPAFAPVQEPLDYDTRTHHSQVDTVDHVSEEGLLQGAQVMAVAAWGLLNGERLPHPAPSDR